jgi:hypothetical protein
MGVALYLVLDNENPGFDAMVDGKAIGKAADKLDVICQTVGIPSVAAFISMSMEEVEEILGDEISEVSEEWFDADDGISYFAKIAAYLREHPSTLDRSSAVIADIDDYLVVLKQARSVGAKWRLSVDV